MKIVNIIGGLGNQMFQYAFALALQQKHPEQEIKIDVTHFNYLFINRIGSANLHNGYEIECIFKNAKLRHASAVDLLKVTWYMPNYFISRIIRRILPKRSKEYIQSPKDIFMFDTNIYNAVGPGYYEGVWQSVKYFSEVKDLIRYTFRHPAPNEYNSCLISQITNTDSVGIHVRRGDYLAAKEFCSICSIDYYKEAIERILQDGTSHVFYIFSNDINWCRENIAPLLTGNNIVYITGNTGRDSYWDMFLMSYCKDLIIANSSFSWWGAYLNNNVNRVFVPYPWLDRECEQDNYMDGWIKITK